ncbi:MAG: fibrobacter succinogenes major paralogous domain-containing protein [Tenuifilaceae bacterium]
MAENLKTTRLNDSTSISNTVDGLYSWSTVSTGKLCPTGWHVSTVEDWTILANYLGGIYVAGNKLRETGTVHWRYPNEGATNEVGFTALPRIYSEGYYGSWWSIDYNEPNNAYLYSISYNSSSLDKYVTSSKINVRCVKNK